MFYKRTTPEKIVFEFSIGSSEHHSDKNAFLYKKISLLFVLAVFIVNFVIIFVVSVTI